MQRFFFDYTQDGKEQLDSVGLDFAVLEAAEMEASRALAELLMDSPCGPGTREIACTIRNEHGRRLARFSVTWRAERL